MLCENWPTSSITVNKYFLLLESTFFVSLKTVSHFIWQNLEAIDHPIPEIKNYNDRHMTFLHKYEHLNIMAQYIYLYIFTIIIDRWSFLQILRQMN